MNATLEHGEFWECPTCGDDHGSEYLARFCCEPNYHHARWVCRCEAVHSSEEEAEDCCSDHDARKKLEAHGQKRLELEETK